MLTIKLSSAGSILISQSSVVSIGLQGSELFHSVKFMNYGEGKAVQLDTVQMFPETFDDNGEPLTEEMILNIPRPVDAPLVAPVGLLITDISSPEHPGITGTNYQFIYPGDVAEVLNENGIKIHEIK